MLDRSPNTLIIGENGSGKSTLADAMCFALFGRPYRNINKPQMVNSVNGKNLLVEIDFSIGRRMYKIRRGIKPTIFEIFIDGKMVDQSAKARDYQDYLEKIILKLNYKSFTQIVILGSSNFIPFMQLKAASRREIIENLLDIRVFSVMNMLLKQRIAENKEDIRDVNYQLDLVEEKIELHKKFVEEQQKDNEDQIRRNEKEIESSHLSIKETQQMLSLMTEECQELANKISDAVDNHNHSVELSRAGETIKERMTKLDSSIGFYTSHNTCPTCAQQIAEQFRQQTIIRKMGKQEALIELRAGLATRIEAINKRATEIANITAEINDLNDQIATENNAMTSINTYIQKVLADNEALIEAKKSESVDKSARSQLIKDNRKFKKSKERLINKRSLLIIANELLKDRGIKTIIIKQYIPIMNKLINNYLTAMEFFVDFELDENFNETILSRFRDDFSYASFSEGEKQRIDLALLFTWRAVAKLKNSMSTNLLILDETFDSSLDTAGCEDFLKLIYDLGKGTNVFVISHKGDILQDKFRSLIRFEKYKGFTRIMEEQ